MQRRKQVDGLRRLETWCRESGQPVGKVLQPVLFLVFVLASWALRPASRRLPNLTSLTNPGEARVPA